MLWETAVLNKLHKTNKFKDLWQQETPQTKPKSGSLLEDIKQEEIRKQKHNSELFVKYGMEENLDELIRDPHIVDLIKYYDALKDIADADHDQYIYWAGLLFKHCNRKNSKSKGDDGHKYALEGLQLLNKHLRIRTCILGHTLTVLDVAAISIIKGSQDLWNFLQKVDFKDFENIYRFTLWVEGLVGITWEKLNLNQFVTNNRKSKKKGKKNITGSKEIIQAVKANDITKTLDILKANPMLVNSSDSGKKKGSLIHIAVENQNMEMIELLVNHNCDIEALDFENRPPIYWAIENKNLEIVKYFMKLGANLDHLDKYDRNCAYIAARFGNPEALELFIEAGCEVGLSNHTKRAPLIKAATRCQADIEDDPSGSSSTFENKPFHSVVRLLLGTKKVDADAADSQGKTSLHYCVHGKKSIRDGVDFNKSSLGSAEVTQMLLEYGANPRLKDNHGNTPLHITCLTFGLNCMRLLLSYGADINEKNDYGYTPFMNACFKGNYECCQILYEYDELDTTQRCNEGYDGFELAIRGGQDRLIKWVIEERINKGVQHKGLEIDSYEPQKLLHHAVNIPETNCIILLQLLNYIWNGNPDVLITCFEDILNRAMLRKSKEAVNTLLNFYQEKGLHEIIKLSEVSLEYSIYLNDYDIFNDMLLLYDGDLPQVALQSSIENQNELYTEILLNKYSDLFQVEELYQDLSSLPPHFTKIVDDDILKDYRYFEKITHPIFSDETKLAHFLKYNPLQLAVYLDNSKIMKLIFDRTCYKASTPLANGDNILHLVVSHAEGDPYILQKLLLRLEFENGSKEAVRTQFLEQKNQADGLSVIEFCAGMKIYAPIVFKYTSVDGCPEDDMYAAARVLDIEIVHDQTLEEEAKADKKAVAEEVRLAAKQQKKHLIKSTEMIAKKYQYVVDYSVQCGLDLSDISYIEKIPTIKDKPYKFIDTLEDLKECAEDLATHNVLGVDLEFSGDKRIAIASLLQISTLETDYIIDALILRHSMGPILTPIFGDPKVVKIFHGCDYDILLLLTDLEIDIINVFDTGKALQEMMRVTATSEPLMVSFDYLVSAFLGFKANKFFQRAEWRLRPLPKVMLNYARADSHYLHFIYAILMDLMADATKPVALSEATAEEHKAMLEERTTNPAKWKGVLREFQKKMAKFMVQRIEKSGKRTYQVIVHKDE